MRGQEFKSGLSQGITTGNGPYKGKQIVLAESLDKLDLDDLGFGNDFRPP